MPLLGKAALALWFDVSPELQHELEHWHAHEHFPERLGLPGFLRGTRWTAADGGEGFFVLYELQDHEVLASPAYAARLNAPSPWSVRMMPAHRGMVRAQCRVVHSRGAFVARHALTVRCSALDAPTVQHRVGELAATLMHRPGLVGLHLLHHEAPALAPTTEQAIRGHADQAADRVFVCCGYELDALRAVAAAELGDTALQALGFAPGAVRQFHTLACSATPADVL